MGTALLARTDPLFEQARAIAQASGKRQQQNRFLVCSTAIDDMVFISKDNTENPDGIHSVSVEQRGIALYWAQRGGIRGNTSLTAEQRARIQAASEQLKTDEHDDGPSYDALGMAAHYFM